VAERIGDAQLSPRAARRTANTVSDLARHGQLSSTSPSLVGAGALVDCGAPPANGELVYLARPVCDPLDPVMPPAPASKPLGANSPVPDGPHDLTNTRRNGQFKRAVRLAPAASAAAWISR
jgi:hypothetical protein